MEADAEHREPPLTMTPLGPLNSQLTPSQASSLVVIVSKNLKQMRKSGERGCCYIQFSALQYKEKANICCCQLDLQLQACLYLIHTELLRGHFCCLWRAQFLLADEEDGSPQDSLWEICFLFLYITISL